MSFMDRHKGTKDTAVPRAWNVEPSFFCASTRGSLVLSLQDLLVKCCPLPRDHSSPNDELLPCKDLSRVAHSHNERNDISHSTTSSKEVIELGKILGLFARCLDILRQQYGNDLKKSLTALENDSNEPKLQERPHLDRTRRADYIHNR
jgi:hypothetical protein